MHFFDQKYNNTMKYYKHLRQLFTILILLKSKLFYDGKAAFLVALIFSAM